MYNAGRKGQETEQVAEWEWLAGCFESSGQAIATCTQELTMASIHDLYHQGLTCPFPSFVAQEEFEAVNKQVQNVLAANSSHNAARQSYLGPDTASKTEAQSVATQNFLEVVREVWHRSHPHSLVCFSWQCSHLMFCAEKHCVPRRPWRDQIGMRPGRRVRLTAHSLRQRSLCGLQVMFAAA